MYSTITNVKGAWTCYQACCCVIFTAAYLERALSQGYVQKTQRSSFFTVVPEICGSFSFRPAQKLIKGRFVYVSLKPAVETLILTYVFWKSLRYDCVMFYLCRKCPFTVTSRLRRCSVMCEHPSSFLCQKNRVG